MVRSGAQTKIPATISIFIMDHQNHPDFRVPGGPGAGAVLADLKFMSCNPSQYPHNPRPLRRDGEPITAVDRRAAGLTAYYANEARKVDVQFCGVPPDQQGPVLRRLLSHGPVVGYVVGRWGEMSEALLNLISELAEARVSILKQLPGAQTPGRRGASRLTDSGMKSILVGQLRRELSLVAVRAQARLLLDRVEGFMADGAVEAARRRAGAEQTERLLALERRAQEVARRQGRQLVRRGDFKLN